MILSFMGERKSGKDFLCDFLVREYGAVRLSFSDEVRRLAVKVFPWLPFDFDPAVKDKPFIHEKNPFGLTPRDIWLLVGKVREVNPKYFVEAFEENNQIFLEQRHRQDRLYVITDFRTPDEEVFLDRYRIPVVKIEREDRTGIQPDSFEQFVREYKKYNRLFINRMNGTSEFNTFFRKFMYGE